MPLEATLREKSCAICGNQFKPASARQKYCSLVCKHGRETCRHCGGSFVPGKKTAREFCSRSCWYEFAKERPANFRTCAQCSVQYRDMPSNGRKFCSAACANDAKRVTTKSRECAVCGGEIAGNRPAFARFCSRTCSNQGRAKTSRLVPNGTRHVLDSGYAVVKTDDGWVLEHRVVMAETLGRPLEKKERIHHRDGDRSNNLPGNLELWKLKSNQPGGVRQADYHCKGCRCAEMNGVS